MDNNKPLYIPLKFWYVESQALCIPLCSLRFPDIDIINKNIILKIWRKYKMKQNLRILYRTSLFRDELIYKPNIGYKYFESLEEFNNNNNK